MAQMQCQRRAAKLKVEIMNTTMRRMLMCGLLLVLLVCALPARAFYDPGLGRWINRDPLGESGYESLRRPDSISMHGGAELYVFVQNNPVKAIDPMGLAIWLCTRKVSGFPFVGNHAYLWNDRNKKPCGMNASSGGGPRGRPSTDTGPGMPGQSCTKVDGSNGKEDGVMNCCDKNANNGLWFPLFNDCHNAVDDCLEKNGLKPPKHYRTEPPEFDGTQFP